MDRAKLTKLAPEFNWTETLRDMGVASAPTVDVSEPSAVAAAGKRIGDVPLSTWKEYLTFRFVSDHAPSLPKPFDDLRFGFYSKTLNDVPEQRARWKRGMSRLDDSLGEAVGQLYVAKYWPQETDRQAKELVADVRAAYQEKIENAVWMDETTRKKALQKLASFDPRVGHPVKWIDYSDLRVSRSDPLANEIATEDFQWKLQLKRFPNPVDRTLWDMTPQTVNAYYDPTMNQITVPAAILQPPFFDPMVDPAVNYGGIGASIAHEMTHQFDDQGAKYDEQGRLASWWSAADRAAFAKRTAVLTAQFDRYEPLAGLHVNGALTLGENIADLGGLTIAYDAYRASLGGREAPVIDGLTGDQRFFLGWAQIWRLKYRDADLRRRLLTNPHAPAAQRVWTARNMEAWVRAFGVSAADPLYLAAGDRAAIW
jgi:endothelin-converting enzyme/putative endopeptidase